MNKRQLIKEATWMYWERIGRRRQDGVVLHQQPNAKLSSVEIVGSVPVVTLKNARGVLAKIRMTPKARQRMLELTVGELASIRRRFLEATVKKWNKVGLEDKEPSEVEGDEAGK